MSKQAVRLLAANLGIGEDTGFVECPFCQAPHEEKFSVTRTETGLLYNCFRASCSAGGFIGTGYWQPDVGAKPVRPKRRPYLKPLHRLTEADKLFFVDVWSIRPTEFMHTQEDEYAFPILNPDGYRKGWVIRQPVWKGRYTCHRDGVAGKPKALTYKDELEASRLSWSPQLTDSKHVVIVEDIISAWKVGQFTAARGVALNGADLGYEEVREIGRFRPDAVTIWLDPDATNQAYKIQSKWGLSFNYCHVVTTDADPKDHDPDKMQEVINVEWEYLDA